jgi:hypothetical protein
MSPYFDFSTFVSCTFLAKKVLKPFSSKASSNFQQTLVGKTYSVSQIWSLD